MNIQINQKVTVAEEWVVGPTSGVGTVGEILSNGNIVVRFPSGFNCEYLPQHLNGL